MNSYIKILLLVFLFSTCKKDDEIFTTKNATVIVLPIVDTNFTFNLYPNPCITSTNLAMNFPRASSLKISILDLTGKEVYFSNISMLAAGKNFVAIDVHSLQSGVYIMSCEYDSGKIMKKFIKSN